MGGEDPTFLDQIYATALDARGWETVMGRFADMVGGGSGFLSALDLVTGKSAVILSRCDPSLLVAFDQHYAAINPLNNVPDPSAFLRDWRATIVTDEDRLPKYEYVRTEYYNDFGLPNDSHSVMMIRLGRYGATPQVLNINRPRRRGSFDEPLVAEAKCGARLHHGHSRRQRAWRRAGQYQPDFRELRARTGKLGPGAGWLRGRRRGHPFAPARSGRRLKS
jgi:hypothetical protein